MLRTRGAIVILSIVKDGMSGLTIEVLEGDPAVQMQVLVMWPYDFCPLGGKTVVLEQFGLLVSIDVFPFGALKHRSPYSCRIGRGGVRVDQFPSG